LFIGNVWEALDKRLFGVGIFFYLTKVYDVIDHDTFLEKLDHYGVRGIQSLCLKLNKACYIIKSLKDIASLYTLRNKYFAKFQSLVSYGLIFWGGERETHKVLKIQKRINRLMKGVKSRTSCKPIFKELKILTVTSLYIFEVVCCFQKYDLYSTRNFDLYEYDTRRKDDFHIQNCNT
jgi:hypothetical protein